MLCSLDDWAKLWLGLYAAAFEDRPIVRQPNVNANSNTGKAPSLPTPAASPGPHEYELTPPMESSHYFAYGGACDSEDGSPLAGYKVCEV